MKMKSRHVMFIKYHTNNVQTRTDKVAKKEGEGCAYLHTHRGNNQTNENKIRFFKNEILRPQRISEIEKERSRIDFNI